MVSRSALFTFGVKLYSGFSSPTKFVAFALSFAKVYKNHKRAKNGQKLLFYNFFALSLQSQTRVAKLVDALVSGSSGVTTLSVRVRSRVHRIADNLLIVSYFYFISQKQAILLFFRCGKSLPRRLLPSPSIKADGRRAENTTGRHTECC